VTYLLRPPKSAQLQHIFSGIGSLAKAGHPTTAFPIRNNCCRWPPCLRLSLIGLSVELRGKHSRPLRAHNEGKKKMMAVEPEGFQVDKPVAANISSYTAFDSTAQQYKAKVDLDVWVVSSWLCGYEYIHTSILERSLIRESWSRGERVQGCVQIVASLAFVLNGYYTSLRIPERANPIHI
jgi:hypothetical protein